MDFRERCRHCEARSRLWNISSVDWYGQNLYLAIFLSNKYCLFFSFLLYIKEPLNKNKLFNPQGHFFLLKPHQSDELLRFPWVSSSNFVASAMLRTDTNICLVKHLFGSGISVHGDGVLYLAQRLLKCWFLLGCSRWNGVENCSCGLHMGTSSVSCIWKLRSDSQRRTNKTMQLQKYTFCKHRGNRRE